MNNISSTSNARPPYISQSQKDSLSDWELERRYDELRSFYTKPSPSFWGDVARKEQYYRRVARLFRWANLYRTTLLNQEMLPSGNGYIYVSNHIGSFDQFIVACMLRDIPLHYLVKDKVTKWPIRWNILYKPTGVVVVAPSSRSSWISAKSELIRFLLNGKNVFIFPEGTRRGPDNIGDFNIGVAQVAQESGTSVVTLAIKNSAHLFRGNPIVCVGKTLSVGARDNLISATKGIQAAVLEAYGSILSFEKTVSDRRLLV